MNRSPHLSDDQLIASLYGLGDAEGHLAGCADCGERWNAMCRALGKSRAESAPEINGRLLAAQRRQILERLEQRSSGAWRWVSPAAAALLAVALLLSRPSFLSRAPQPAPPAAVNAEADAELFTEVYSMEQDVEPRAAAPIRSLFQETSFEKEGQ
jgi:anti-sigma-K factor RskA